MPDYPLSIPSRPGRQEITWGTQSAVAVTRSPFTLVEQVYEWPGTQWLCTIKMPSMEQRDGKAWEAFFTAANGRAGRFLLADSAFRRNAELALGAPVVSIAVTASRQVTTSGWAADREVAAAGDMLAIAGRIRRVLRDATSDAGGVSILSVWPPLANVPAGSPVEWREPSGLFRLVDIPPMTWGRNGLLNPFTFSCEEVLAE